MSEAKVERIAKVRAKGAPELVAALERGEVSVSAAAAVATLPFKKQSEIVACGPAAVVQAAKAVTGRLTPNEKRQIKERTEHYQAVAEPAHDLTTPPSVAALPPQSSPQHSAPAAGPLTSLDGMTANEFVEWIKTTTTLSDRVPALIRMLLSATATLAVKHCSSDKAAVEVGFFVRRVRRAQRKARPKSGRERGR